MTVSDCRLPVSTRSTTQLPPPAPHDVTTPTQDLDLDRALGLTKLARTIACAIRDQFKTDRSIRDKFMGLAK